MIVGSLTKQPAERFPVTIDFAKDLGTGETISSAIVTAKNVATGADSTATLIDGSATTSSTKATQVIKSGTTGEDHLVQFRATTSAGYTLEAEVLVQVRET